MPDQRRLRDEFANRTAAVPNSRHKKSLCRNGLQYREDTGRWVLGRKPKGFKMKLSLGSYKKEKDALIACDFCTYQIEKQPTHEDFNYKLSPDVFSNLPPLSMDFWSLDPNCPDKEGKPHCQFSNEMRGIIKWLTNQDEEVHWTKWERWIPMDNSNASEPSFPPLQIIPELDIIPESYIDISQHVLEEPHSADSEGPRGLLSNQLESVVHNLPSHVERYDCSVLIQGLPIDTGAFLL